MPLINLGLLIKLICLVEGHLALKQALCWQKLESEKKGQLELRAPLGATPLNLRMQAQTAARGTKEDILAHVTLTGAGSRDSRLLPVWDQTRVWDPGD